MPYIVIIHYLKKLAYLWIRVLLICIHVELSIVWICSFQINNRACPIHTICSCWRCSYDSQGRCPSMYCSHLYIHVRGYSVFCGCTIQAGKWNELLEFLLQGSQHAEQTHREVRLSDNQCVGLVNNNLLSMIVSQCPDVDAVV